MAPGSVILCRKAGLRSSFGLYVGILDCEYLSYSVRKQTVQLQARNSGARLNRSIAIRYTQALVFS